MTVVVVVIHESKDSLIKRRAVFLRLDVNVLIFYRSPKSFYPDVVFRPATAVFLIKDLHSFGYSISNELFASHSWYFRNALVVDYPAQSDTSSISKGQNDTLNVTLEERAVLNLIITNPRAKQTEIAAKIGKSDRTVKRIMDSLKEKGVINRRNGKRDGWWDVLVEIPEAQ